MKIKILNVELNYSIQEIGFNIDGYFARILIDDWYEDELNFQGHAPKKILKRTTSSLLIPITKKTFKELWEKHNVK